MGTTRFAINDGVNIAYQVVGTGTPDILVYSSAVLPMDSIDEEPSLARFHRRLASFGREIRFDLRGVGMSDPVSLAEPPTLEQWARDAVSVLDAVGSEQAVVFAPRDTSLHALMLATMFPERVASLVLFNGTARMARDDDYPVGVPQHLLDRFIVVNMDPEASSRGFDLLSFAAPSMADDDAFREWWVKAGYRGASPAAARAIQSVYMGADVRAVLPFVQAPTLVLHRRNNELVRVGHGRYLAEHIPGAEYRELEGADDRPFEDIQYTMLARLIAALTSAYPVLGIVGHSDIAPARKTDPGPYFDWSRLPEIPRID
jgi:pimeloyl-ACP methyl ester carboxylesterase